MTSGFRPGRNGSVVIELEPEEAVVLRSMANLMLDLIEPPEPPDSQDEIAAMVGIGTSSEKPDDPVLARLFPDAYDAEADAEAAGEFRRYTEDGMRQRKRANAESVLAVLPESGGRVEFDRSAAQALMKTMNDVRLALAVRLGVDTDTTEAPGAEPSTAVGSPAQSAAALNIYHWLAELLETLVSAMTPTR